MRILTSKRTPIIDKIQHLLLTWITEKQMTADSISEDIDAIKQRNYMKIYKKIHQQAVLLRG